MSDTDFRFMLQQTDGRQRTARKLPAFAALSDWWYPVRLSCEQCSSEATARYKAMLAATHPLLQDTPAKDRVCTDLTGGFGVDSYFTGQTGGIVNYVEHNAELCRIAAHNFGLYAPYIHIHNAEAGAYLSAMPRCQLLLVDPARRNRNGGKVFRIEDCEPNIVSLLPLLQQKAEVLLFKLSPMLDITAARRALSAGVWDTYIVAVENEVKEVLLMTAREAEPRLTAVDLSAQWQAGLPYKKLTVAPADEQKAIPAMATAIRRYVYEPGAAILKAGLYNYTSAHYGIDKFAPNTHLYTSDRLIAGFPGRVWETGTPDEPLRQCNIVTRNYPLSPDQLKKKLKVRDGGEWYMIAARMGYKSVLITAKRVQSIEKTHINADL